MKRREPTADEVALFEASLKDAARLVPKTVITKVRASAKSKKSTPCTEGSVSGPAARPAPQGAKGRSKPSHGRLEPCFLPEPKDATAGQSSTAAERALFESALKDVVPLGAKAVTTAGRGPAKSKAPASLAPVPSGRPGTSPSGLDGRRRAKLKRGSLEPEARLDLHGLTETAAHHALTAFVHQAMRRGLRLILVVTGKGVGEGRDGAADRDPFARPRGVLRQLTPRWLKEPGLARFVAEMTPAHRRHGGEGALYVYLRKPR
jgi:DNA-nicking Smr family endonuclease